MTLTHEQDRIRSRQRHKDLHYRNLNIQRRQSRQLSRVTPEQPSTSNNNPRQHDIPVDPPASPASLESRLNPDNALPQPWWLSFHRSMALTRWHPPTWNSRCPHCGALLLKGEPKGFCCNNGKCVVPPLLQLPHHISYIVNHPEHSKNLSSFSRRLNNLFCFSAIGATKGFSHFTSGLSCVSITGRTYHRIFDITEHTHSLHWFLYDEQERDAQGVRYKVPPQWIRALKADLDIHNPYVHHLRLFHSISPTATSALELGDVSSSGDFAAVMHAANSTNIKPCSIVIWQNNDVGPTFVPIFSRHYEPLQYPLLFPHGTPGWGLTNTASGHSVRSVDFTQREWYKGHLLTDDCFLTFGRLTSEYLCDMYSRIEEERLNFIRRSQPQNNETDGHAASEHINLPASFLGSRKWTSEQTADSLALARTYGPPSFFITMTCNAQWPEITSRLLPTQNANDVPVIVARAFKLRLQRLLLLLRKKFGTLIYCIKIIEFQKRGFPHAHIVIKVSPELPVHLIDTIIKANLPSDNLHLKEKVKKYMTHARNHLTRENSRCRKNNTCIYGFPHPITPETWVDDIGRVHYKRLTEDDQWIAPHIPELVDELDCHIFVDVVFTVAVFTYLYKYLYKGPDHTWFRVNSEHAENEITAYVDGRYLCSPEAAWRMLAFEITSKKPSILCLPVHLPGQNIPRFMGGNDLPASSTSLLIRYFHRPNLPRFSHLTYCDYFEKFILYKWEGDALRDDELLEEPIQRCTRYKVCARQVGVKVARLQTISPTTGELFYLRCLLTHRAARSFVQLRKVNDTVHPSFREAALELGLFTNTNEGRYALLEAIASFHTPAQLRFLFAQIILEGYPAQPLWDEFRDMLSLDHVTNLHSVHLGIERTLQSLSNYIRDARHTLTDFGLPEPALLTPEVMAELNAYANRSDELHTTAQRMVAQMNDEQRHIFTTIMDEILDYVNDGNCYRHPFFVEGKPGRGKTFVVDAITCEIRSQGLIILIVGTSALAATLYEGGRTAHNLFQIPVTEENINLRSKICPNTHRADLIANASIIVWDELPAANIAAFECANNVCRLITGTNRPFGGIPFVGVGDFRQVAPVVKGQGVTPALLASVKSSPLWRSFHHFTLHHPHRSARDPNYTRLVDSIGEDFAHSDVSLQDLPTIYDLTEAINFLYPPHILSDAFACLTRAFLSPKNVHVDTFNNQVLDLLPGPEHNYFSADLIKENNQLLPANDHISPDYLALLTHNGIPNHMLRLKPGCVCSIMRNMSIAKGLVKNARVIIHGLHRRFVEVRVINNRTRELGPVHCIPRIRFEFAPPHSSWTIHRIQLPLRLAYSCTFHGCVGLTLDKTVVDLREPVFAHGQLYTALSRVRSGVDTRLLFDVDNRLLTTKNIVFRELLL